MRKSVYFFAAKRKIIQVPNVPKRKNGLRKRLINAFILATIGFNSLITRYAIWAEPDEKFTVGYYKFHSKDRQESHKKVHRRYAKFCIIFSVIAFPACIVSIISEKHKWLFLILWAVFVITLYGAGFFYKPNTSFRRSGISGHMTR
ncbi:MAG: hypothetical protein ACE5H1_06805 [Thermodesulfobacteriota bacterium]